MGHYSVAVFQDPKQKRTTLEDLLQPFCEENVCPRYITKAEIIERQRKEIEDFNESTYKKYLADPEGYERNTKNTAHINYLKNEFPLRLKWTDEECYQHGLHYYDEDAVRPDGSVFYTYNPNSKWDWYSIGGRFQNLIPLKGGGFTDEASMDDVDIEYHSKEAYKRAIRFWQLVVDEQPPVTEEDEEVVKYAFYKKEYYTERYTSAEDYADFCAGFHVYATLLPNYE